MKNVLLGAIFGLFALNAYVTAAQANEANEATDCRSADEMKNQAEIGSAKHGGQALRLDGPPATVFLDYLNNHVGDPTDYKADTLIVGLYPDLGYALVGFIVNGCADQHIFVKLDPESFMRAYRAARGEPV